jgi:hypothetical protein
VNISEINRGTANTTVFRRVDDGGDYPDHPAAGTVRVVSPDRVARPLTIHPAALSLC